MKFWTTVETSFEVPGRACVIVPRESTSDFQVRRGSSIQLRTPNGAILDTQITAVEMVKVVSGSRLGICLPVECRKEDIPEGTEVWLVDYPVALN